MKFLKTAAVAATLAVFATGAQAATYDFAADADAFATEYGFEGSFDQVYNSPVFFPLLHGDNTDGGLTVNASTVEGGPHPESHPFMDSNTAGLGVCKSGFGVVSGFDPLVSNCNGSSDDNLLWPEILVLTFSDPTSLTGLLIRDAGHALITADYAIDIFDGSSWHTLAASLGVVQGLDALLESGYFKFTTASICNSPCEHSGPEIYISGLTTIPIPAAGFLLLGGLGGLAALRRRKKG